MEEMMDTLANVLGHADTLVLVLKGDTERFTQSLQDMLAKMALIFGSRWWHYLVVGVSFWAYDQDSIDGRVCDPEYPGPQYCKDENWFKNNINGVMHEKFGIEQNFTFVFTDSFSQTAGPPGYNTDDPLQQEHWQEEAGILWDITVSRDEPFNFMTIDDILEENARQRAEIKWLNDVITNNISELAAQIAQNNDAISSNNEAIATNNLAIQENADQDGIVSGRVATNEALIQEVDKRVDDNSGSIEDNSDLIGIVNGRVTTNEAHVATNYLRIQENSANIGANSEDILALLPVGTVIAWLGGYSESSELPTGWQRCDGSLILAGPMLNTRTPDLNGESGHFLRGGTFRQAGSTHEDQLKAHSHSASAHVTDPGHSHQDTGHSHGYGDSWCPWGLGDDSHDGIGSQCTTEDKT